MNIKDISSEDFNEENFVYEEDLAEAEEHSISDYANPNCPICKGKGSHLTFDEHLGVERQTMCTCVFVKKRFYLAELRIQNMFGPNWRKYTFANFDTNDDPWNEQALKAAKNYVENYPTFKEEGYGFALSGPPRAGKTHLITATMIALIKRWNVKPFLESVPRMVRLERERFKNDELDSMIELAMTADVCVLDDLGAEYRKQGTTSGSTQDLTWVEEQLYLILDERIKHSLPTLYTTNLSEGELDTALQERVNKRLKNVTISNYKLVPVPKMMEPDTKFKDLLNK